MRFSTIIASVLRHRLFPRRVGHGDERHGRAAGHPHRPRTAAARRCWPPAWSLSVIGVWACGDHVRETGRKDPSECVIDELAGQWLACAGISFDFAPAAARAIRAGLSAVPPVRHSEAVADFGGGKAAGRLGRDGRRHAGGPGRRHPGGPGAIFPSAKVMFAAALLIGGPRAAGRRAQQRSPHRHRRKLHRRIDRRPAHRNSRLIRCGGARLCHLFQ